MGRASARQWAGAACGVVALALGLEWLIVTDGEAIQAQLATLGSALEARDAEATLAVFDAGFTAPPVDRAALTAVVAAALRTRVISSCAVEVVETTIEGETATTRVAASVVAKLPTGGGFPGQFHITFRWGRGPDGWRIRGLVGDDPWFEGPGGFRELLPPARWLAIASGRIPGD